MHTTLYMPLRCMPVVALLLTVASVGHGTAHGAPPEAAATPPTATAETPWQPPRFTARRNERDRMARLIRTVYGLNDADILAAMKAVPRHEFVPAEGARHAYRDTPLPIGYGQTISQPYIVAEMTRLLELTPESKVLEIGTGSGYQAAILSEFTRNVFTVEIIQILAESADERLRRLGYDVVEVANHDGYRGWREHGPYDAIIVTCAAGEIPLPLIGQLANGGRMVIPVGPVFATQSLMLVEKDSDGKVRSRSLLPVRFVPLLREDTAAGSRKGR